MLKATALFRPSWLQAYISPVAEGGVEGLSPWVEKVPDVTQARDLKNFWLLFNNLSAKIRAEILRTDFHHCHDH